MNKPNRDPGLRWLLDLDGQVFVVDPQGGHWVKFSLRRVAVSADRPHGLEYSLTLHDASGRRLLGYDNAHPVRASGGPGGKPGILRDHRHWLKAVRPYVFHDAATLLEDFWGDVDRILRGRGVIR